eukprot:Gregarina_sp_Pseudo_9__1535@NODE_202_length_3625_cov_22_671779_g187_i0_p3_GENE_NODE_202_length_3625_cov_22_671779_g187_i0NODE_202_length_3625_cov_22_671779_g187_i0_p3_ORF_typecomplete_len229_score53_64Mannitol_dh/PF01232_23/4_5e02Mannitol_dh/PF01232_23/0_28_NODE_202_length_3625_cov_22_671779_g187_i028053491
MFVCQCLHECHSPAEEDNGEAAIESLPLPACSELPRRPRDLASFPSTTKVCLHFGTGPYTRGLLQRAAACKIVLADVIPGLIRELQVTKCWRDGDGDGVGVADAVFANSARCLAYIAQCDVITTAVGPRVLPRLAPTLLRGLLQRKAESNENPLNVLCCEPSPPNAAQSLQTRVCSLATVAEDRQWIATHVGFVNVEVCVTPDGDVWHLQRSQVKGAQSPFPGVLMDN